MEHENMYASKGVAGAGLGLGIAGTALGLMAGGLGNGILGSGRNADSGSMPVSRYEQEQAVRIAALETEVKLRDSNIYTDAKLREIDAKILDLYKYVEGKFAGVDEALCAQRVYNATLNGTVGCIQGQIAQLMGLTKLVIPGSSICPPVTTTTTAG